MRNDRRACEILTLMFLGKESGVDEEVGMTIEK